MENKQEIIRKYEVFYYWMPDDPEAEELSVQLKKYIDYLKDEDRTSINKGMDKE